MRIAQIAPLHVAVPPQGYGGTERCIHSLTEGLVRDGHEVTLFASGDSQTAARLVAPVPTALGFDPRIDATALHLAMLAEIYRQADRFDVIHAHLKYLILPFTDLTDTPTVLTIHSRLDNPGRDRVFRAYPDVHYVSVSRDQQTYIPDLPWRRTIYHGVAVEEFPFSPDPGPYLAFVGRIAPEKRVDRAIAVARATGIPLKIAAKVDSAHYFREVVEPVLDDPLIDYLGVLDEAAKRALLGNALALILPIDWPEPFGLVFIEALACGTPVLTCPSGAAPEIVIDGVTGFLRDTVEGLAEAAHRVRHLSRAACREDATRRFHSRRMVADYTALYEELVAGAIPPRNPT